MPQLTIDTLPLTSRNSITLSFHKKTSMWWAVLLDGHNVKDCREAATPMAALAELLASIAPAGLMRSDA